jgi:hypothetical protein
MRNFSTNAYLDIAVIIGVFGLLELKEFFKPSKNGSIVESSPKYSAKIKSISQNIS